MSFVQRILDRWLGEPGTADLPAEAAASSEEAKQKVKELRGSTAGILKQVRSERREADKVLDVVHETTDILKGVEERAESRDQETMTKLLEDTLDLLRRRKDNNEHR